jgi:hypothetical protein
LLPAKLPLLPDHCQVPIPFGVNLAVPGQHVPRREEPIALCKRTLL